MKGGALAQKNGESDWLVEILPDTAEVLDEFGITASYFVLITVRELY